MKLRTILLIEACVLIGILLFVIAPFIGPYFIPTHDGEYHIIRFSEFYTMLSSGIFFPRWAPNLNSGYGIPLFNFHYPFPNYIGSLFHVLGFSFVDSFKLSLALGYLLSALFCFVWLSKIFQRHAAIVGTILFCTVPYWFVDLYIRGSVGEIYAIFWLMVALSSLEYKWKIIVPIAIAGLILSHNILAMIFIPLVVVYMIVRKIRLYWHMGLGISLAGYFWIPALLEQSYVTGLNTVNFSDHFANFFQLIIPSWGSGFSRQGIYADEMSQQIGTATIIVFILSFYFLHREKKSGLKNVLLFFSLLPIVVGFMMLESSQSLWTAFPILQKIQYPFRFLSFMLPVSGILGAYVWVKLKHRLWITIFLILIVSYSLYSFRPVFYAPRSDEYYLSKKEFTDGTSSLDNAFSTKWSSWKPERPGKKLEVVHGEADVRFHENNPLSYEIIGQAKSESVLRINTVYYPGWKVQQSAKALPVMPDNEGVLSITIPQGSLALKVYFSETPLRVFADMLSLCSLFWLVGSVILKRYAYRN